MSWAIEPLGATTVAARRRPWAPHGWKIWRAADDRFVALPSDDLLVVHETASGFPRVAEFPVPRATRTLAVAPDAALIAVYDGRAVRTIGPDGAVLACWFPGYPAKRPGEYSGLLFDRWGERLWFVTGSLYDPLRVWLLETATLDVVGTVGPLEDLMTEPQFRLHPREPVVGLGSGFFRDDGAEPQRLEPALLTCGASGQPGFSPDGASFAALGGTSVSTWTWPGCAPVARSKEWEPDVLPVDAAYVGDSVRLALLGQRSGHRKAQVVILDADHLAERERVPIGDLDPLDAGLFVLRTGDLLTIEPAGRDERVCRLQSLSRRGSAAPLAAAFPGGPIDD